MKRLLIVAILLLIATAACSSEVPHIARGGSAYVPYQTNATRTRQPYRWRVVYVNPRQGTAQVIATSGNPRGWAAAHATEGALVRVPATARPTGKVGWYRIECSVGPSRGNVYGLGAFYVY